MITQFKPGDRVICIGSGWRQGRTALVESVHEEHERPVYRLDFGGDKKSYVTENELALDERIDVSPNEILILDADHVTAEMGSEVAQRLGRMTVLVKGGKKNIDKVDRKDLRASLDALDAVVDPKKPPKA